MLGDIRRLSTREGGMPRLRRVCSSHIKLLRRGWLAKLQARASIRPQTRESWWSSVQGHTIRHTSEAVLLGPSRTVRPRAWACHAAPSGAAITRVASGVHIG